MAKKVLTYIDAAKFQAIITELQAHAEEKAGWVKVNGATGRRVYVPRTKRVGRVDIAGFEMAEGTAGICNLGGGSFGAVKQQLDFTRSEDEILNSFKEVLIHMLSLPAAEKVARVAPMSSKKDAEQRMKDHVPKPAQASKAERLALIKKVAAEKGVPVSLKTLEALSDECAEAVEQISE